MFILQIALLSAFPALAIVAALKDVTTFTIPNWISLALAGLFTPAALASGLELSQIGLHFAIGVAALVGGMAMFAVRWIGGGDAKLLAAASLWIGLEAIVPFLVYTALAGGLLAVFLLSVRSNFARAMLPAGPGWVERLREPKGDAPYGLAIAAGALLAFPQCALVAAAA